MSEEFHPLKGAQADIRAAFFDQESGLFALDCVPGFGKSMTVERIAAEALVRLDAEGRYCPERHLCVASFSRDDAASLEPGIRAALDAFADDDTQTAVTIDDTTAEHLKDRLRHSDHIGTIDSVLRSVFADIATELGFDGMPAVGNDALLATLHDDCIEALRTDPSHTDTFAELENAYPGEEDDAADVETLLDAMREERRSRRLSNDDFRAHLQAAVDDVFPNGKPESLTDLREDVASFFDDKTASVFAAKHRSDNASDDASDAGDADDVGELGHGGDAGNDVRPIVADDQACYDEWKTCIDDICELLHAYETVYDEKCRERGVLDYTDVAYWVAEYFAGSVERPASDGAGISREYRARLTDRYASQFQTILIDEAQDVSVVQHDALAQLVPDDARVLLSGDADQCIYEWRTAQPSLFRAAIEDGSYFGRTWSNHVFERGDKSYRMRPDIVTAVNGIFSQVFTDPDRGQDQQVSSSYTPIHADRSAGDSASVHVVNPHSPGHPDSNEWSRKEATALTRYVRGCVEDDALEIRGPENPPLTVLFPTGTNMEEFATAFREQGFSVANKRVNLFAEPIVEVVCAVVQWLVNPHDPTRIATLEDEDCFDFWDSPADAAFSTQEGIQCESDFESDAERQFVRDLTRLAGRRPRLAADSGTHVVETIVEALELRADPLELTDDGRQRLATLDTLIDTVSAWEGEDRYSLRELAAVLQRYRSNPRDGPYRPVADNSSYDIVFRTVHNMKGDEASAVCIADGTRSLDSRGPITETFITRGDTIALAPPATVSPTPVIENETPQSDETSICGLRWKEDFQPETTSAGPPPLTETQSRYRAEWWRLLYVAMSRARDDLILSLPHTAALDEAESWTVSIREILDLDPRPASGMHSRDFDDVPPDRSLSLAVNDVPFDGWPPLQTANPILRAARPAAEIKTELVPQYVNGSQFHPLIANLEENILDYLRNRSLATDEEQRDRECLRTVDSIEPDSIGHVVHDVLTTAVARDLTAEDLRACRCGLDEILDQSLDDRIESASKTDRSEVKSFVQNEICPQFAATAAWERLRDAQAYYVESKLSSVLDVGVEIETHNRADIVTVDADGHWHVDDLKLLLSTPNSKRRHRYQVQAAFYAMLLARQLPPDADVTAWVTHLGVKTGTEAVDQLFMDINEWLQRSFE